MGKPVAVFPKKRIAILGGGCAGLAAALRLIKKDYEVFIFEQNSQLGGICGGINFNGNIYDYGPHLFHTTDKEILNDIKNISGPNMFSINRTILIKFMDKYYKYPLSIKDIIFKISPIVTIKAFFSFIFYVSKGLVVKPFKRNSETVLISSYGRTLYDLFFKSYIMRVWGISPVEFSPKFAEQRIPKITAIDFIFKIVSIFDIFVKKKALVNNYVEKVEGPLYTTKIGFLGIINKIREVIRSTGGHVCLNKKVIRLECERNEIKKITTQDSEVFECDGVISTLPINNLVQIIKPSFSEEILKSSEQLKFRAIAFVGLLIKKEKVLPAAFVYFREHSFNRVTDFSYFNFEINPRGHTIVVAEISCDANDRFWHDDDFCKREAIKDLIKEGFISEDVLKEVHVFRLEHGYPIYTLGFEEILKNIFKSLKDIENLTIAGRQGEFQYINAHIAIRMGYEAADLLDMKLKNTGNNI